MLSRLGYGLATLLVVALALACVAWAALEPPALPVPPKALVVIRDVTLVNPGLGRSEHVDITVRDGVIAAIGPAGGKATRADLRCDGCYALPGLIDMSGRVRPDGHVGDERNEALLYLAHGVTAVRDPDAFDRPAAAVRDAIAEGRYPGPRILSCQDGRPGACRGELDMPTPPGDEAGRRALAQVALQRQAAYAPHLAAASGAGRAEFVRALFRSGTPIYAAGSSASPGASLHAELRAFKALGASDEGALVTATTSPGRYWPETTYGQIAIGLPADLVLYRRDPTRDLTALDSLAYVIAAGRAYPAAQLAAWTARYRRHFEALRNPPF
ncbi:MAG TPA: hypothetical protein VG939_13745 [Caulobacteraceae bacterium]|nr:hypothetical protein [Caulobacteraceae bacterium]